MKKPIFLLLLLFILAITGCSNSLSSANSKEAKIKVGIRSSELRTWEFIKEKAKKQGLDIELVNFSSAYDPNQALVEGEIDVNAFQHVAYLDLFNQKCLTRKLLDDKSSTLQNVYLIDFTGHILRRIL